MLNIPETMMETFFYLNLSGDLYKNSLSRT